MIAPPNNVPVAEGVMPPAWREWFARVGMLSNGDSGTTANRPTKGLYLGKSYFDTDLGYPVYLQSVNPSVWASGSVPLEAVIMPTLLNSWVDYGTPWEVAGYWKSEGVVTLKGLIKSGAVGSSAFTLPVAYRPPADLSFPTSSAGAFGLLQVLADGSVTPNVGSNVAFSLSGVSFRV